MRQQRQIRLTPQRQAVLDVVRASKNHPTAMEVLEQVRARQPQIAYSTVYTALTALVEAGLLMELRIAGHPARYDARTEAHHHALCTRCGRIVEAELALTHEQWRQLARQTGYRVEDVHIEIYGLCPECQNRARREDWSGREGPQTADGR